MALLEQHLKVVLQKTLNQQAGERGILLVCLVERGILIQTTNHLLKLLVVVLGDVKVLPEMAAGMVQLDFQLLPMVMGGDNDTVMNR